LTGRFTTTDPFEGFLGDPGTLHRYSYARSNPIAFSDPSGRLTNFTGAIVVSGLISGLASLAINAYKGKRGWELVGGAVVDGVLGAATAALGGAAAAGITKTLFGEAMLQTATRGVVVLTVAVTKASVSTFITVFKSALDNDTAALDGKQPPSAMAGIVYFGALFLTNLVFETAFAGISSARDFRTAGKEIVGDGFEGVKRELLEGIAENAEAQLTRAWGDVAKYVESELAEAGWRAARMTIADIEKRATQILVARFTTNYFSKARDVTQFLESVTRGLYKTALTKFEGETYKSKAP
jgi:hypothetical protein